MFATWYKVRCGSVEIWRWRRTSCPSHVPLRRSEAHVMESCRVTSSHLRHSLAECTWIEIGSCWALPNFLCHPTICVLSHCLVDSEVAFGSVVMGFLKMQWPPSTGATRHGVVGGPSSCHDVSSRRHPIPRCFLGLDLKGRCHHVWSVFAWNVKMKR